MQYYSRFIPIRLLLPLTILLISQSNLYAQAQRYTISGYVREKGSAELLIGVNAFIPAIKAGTTTNNYGFYSITLPADTVELVFSYVGYRPEARKILLNQNIALNIELQSEMTLQEVVITDEKIRQEVSRSAQMSVIEIPVQQIKELPALLGEKDVLKVLQLMPGVQSGSEGNSGLYVRGGGPDQNLLILDDATVYNAYHLFGFFSLFNGDALKSVELTKGGFPARYGGRLSSVVEMNMKEGNKEKISGEAGIGLISSRLTLEGPIKKDKSSFLVSGRRTYIDVLARPFMPKNERGGYYFYDLNTKFNYDFGRKDKLYLSGYFGEDRFSAYYNENDRFGRKSASRSGLYWGNATGTVRWNHLFHDKLFTNTSLVFSNYNFNIFENMQYNGGRYELSYKSGIRDYGIKYDLDYMPNLQHKLRAGVISTFHRFTPSALVVKDSEVNMHESKITAIDAVESGLYIEDNYQPSSKVRINAGFRLSHFATQSRHYFNPEPRFSGAYSLRDDFSVKASYATMNQYIHLLSNTNIGLPTDLWVPATRNIAPQQSQQVAAGFAKDFTNRNLAITIEGYYKKSNNVVGYKEGASFLLLEEGPEGAEKINWEDNITQGQGWSYGVEFLLQRKFGKLSGWIGYTLSWTQLQFDSLNNGNKFYARYDRRHDISAVAIYKLNKKITFSGTWVYGTGNALTLPMASYDVPYHRPGNNPAPYDRWEIYYNQAQDYGEKNSFRMAPYHRLDIGIQFHKEKKLFGRSFTRTWDLSVYNAYNRQNPFFYFIGYENSRTVNREDEEPKRVLKQISLFPIIPSITYNIKF